MRILVIDDDPQLVKLLRRGLVEEGFTVDVATDGETGRRLAESEPCDAIILDVMLPKATGLQVLEHLRARENPVPVLILTARDAVSDTVAGLNAGADDYMTKPFTFAELIARLRALIRRAHRAPSAVVRIADLEIDLGARRVARAGKPIELTARQYAILELLALNRGRVVTRTSIYDHVYASDSDTLSNVVDVHVCKLREALEQGAPGRLIRTVRGQGYILEAP